MRREIFEGDLIPRFYGVAYLSPYRRTYVCYPFPINKVVGSLRQWWIKHRNYKVLKRDSQISAHIEGLIRKARNEGYCQGMMERTRLSYSAIAHVKRILGLKGADHEGA